jgi:hypothetical protein
LSRHDKSKLLKGLKAVALCSEMFLERDASHRISGIQILGQSRVGRIIWPLDSWIETGHHELLAEMCLAGIWI